MQSTVPPPKKDPEIWGETAIVQMLAGECVPSRSSDRGLSHHLWRIPLLCLPKAGWFKEIVPLVAAFDPSILIPDGSLSEASRIM